MTEQTLKNYIKELLAEQQALEEEVEDANHLVKMQETQIRSLKVKNIVDTFEIYKYSVKDARNEIEELTAGIPHYAHQNIEIAYAYFNKSLRNNEFIELHKKAREENVNFDDVLAGIGERIYWVFKEVKEEESNNEKSI